MKEIRDIVETYGQIDLAKHKVALAMVARVEGSSYRRIGARMLVLDNGTYLGGISGGCLEGDALRRAQKAIAANKPSIVTYDTTQEDHHQIGVGLGCNGIIDVLFTPLNVTDPYNSVKLLADRVQSRQVQLLATITQCSAYPELLGSTLPFESKAQWLQNFFIPAIAESVLSDGLKCLNSRKTQTLCYKLPPNDNVQICLEILVPATQLMLFGHNNDLYPMVLIGKALGWDLTIMANPLKIENKLFATGVKILPPSETEQATIDEYTAVVLMAHDYKTDFKNFQRVLRSSARYIGMLGPQKRAQKMFDQLKAEGTPVSQQDMERIYAPVGLDIGAVSPEEIALSITAEIRACFAGRLGMSLRHRDGAIHDIL